eukprot:TRINITY_DN2765_c0_g1_i1.p1 TRINITY_DN2765_c0_g1~~TRINITY_DN2765_c0_g1_i1.p1  ORF type:complete len:377 (+),score=161.52 TRINITY_DN2765_c0_g1_i1:161-1291(+)
MMKSNQMDRKESERNFVREAAGSWPNVSPNKGKWVDPKHSSQTIPNMNHSQHDHVIDSSLRFRPPKDEMTSFVGESNPSFPLFEDPMMEELEKELFSPPVFDFSPASNASLRTSGNHSMNNSPMLFNPQLIPAAPPVPTFNANARSGNNRSSSIKPQVSPAIADRQKQLDKKKRSTLSRSSDVNRRSQAAAQRPRDGHGHFAKAGVDNVKTEKPPSPPSQIPSPTSDTSINDVITLLCESKRESFELKNKLALVFDEMLSLREKAQEASAAKEKIKQELENQQKINNMLLQQNRLLWSTVPQKEVFSTINGGMPSVNLQSFKDKIDLSKTSLHSINSPHLEAAKDEDENFGKRWEEMSFLMGFIHPPQYQDNVIKP